MQRFNAGLLKVVEVMEVLLEGMRKAVDRRRLALKELFSKRNESSWIQVLSDRLDAFGLVEKQMRWVHKMSSSRVGEHKLELGKNLEEWTLAMSSLLQNLQVLVEMHSGLEREQLADL